MFSAVPLHPCHFGLLDRQPSQLVQLGVEVSMDDEEMYALAAEREAWACYDGDRLIACVGIRETFPETQGVAWAVLASGVGRATLALTRFARSRILGSGLKRIEAVARAGDAEAILAQYPELNAAQLSEAVMALPTPECAWARLVGLSPAHVLRKFGQAAETHMLFERIAGHG